MMNKKTSKINYKTLNNFFIFLLISLLFSTIVKLTKVYTKNISYKINLSEVPDNKIVTSQSVDSINLTVSSFGFDFIKHYLSNKSIVIPSQNVIDDSNSFILTQSNSYMEIDDFIKPEFDLISINFDSLFFRYDQLKSKKIPIILNSNISFYQGYDYFKAHKLSTDSVTVVGPELVLDSINSISTFELNLTDIRSDVNQSVELNVLDYNDVKYSDLFVEVSIDVEKSTESILSIPMSIINIPKGVNINYYPKSIKVSFSVSLENYQIYQAEDFEIICDYSQIYENGELSPVIITKPNFIKNFRLINEKVQYVVLK